MTAPGHLLPPNATALEKALSLTGGARLASVPIAVDQLWNPATCPAELLPWLAWGLSIDVWDSDWPEATKRDAIADAIEFQRRKGTPASLRTVLDRIDPAIRVVEWFDDRDVMPPYHFRLELPLAADSDVTYDETTVARILAYIGQVKPVRAQMSAVHRLVGQASAWLLTVGRVVGLDHIDVLSDTASALDPVWATYLQTETGEPILDEAGAYLEV